MAGDKLINERCDRANAENAPISTGPVGYRRHSTSTLTVCHHHAARQEYSCPYTVAGMRLEHVVHTNAMSCSKRCSPQCVYLKDANEVGGGMRKADSNFQRQGRATRQTHKDTTKKVHRERTKRRIL